MTEIRKPTPLTFGTGIRIARENLGLSRKELAEKTHLSLGTVSKIERDQREPRLTTALQLAKSFDMTLDELLAGRRVTKRKPA